MSTATPTRYPGREHAEPSILRLAFIYPSVVLVVLALQGSFVQSVAALCLAALVFVAGMTSRARLLAATSGGSLFFIIAALEPYLGAWAVLPAAPTTLVMMHGLSLTVDPAGLPRRPGASFSPTFAGWTLLLGVATLWVLGIVADSRPMLLGSAALSAMIVIRTGAWAWRMDAAGLTVQCEPISLVAGTTTTREVRISTRTSGLLALATDHSTVRLSPSTLVVGPSPSIVRLTLRPFLSGPHIVTAWACISDPLGLLAAGRNVQLVSVTVIPRARALERAALQFLEGRAGSGATMSPAASEALPHLLLRDSGVEYAGSRTYAPGDRLRSIDWKHSAKLRRAVVKRYLNETRSNGILLVNRTVADEDEADRLAYELLSAALTIAREGLGAAVVTYEASGDFPAHARVLSGRGLVQHALDVARGLVLDSPYPRLLETRSLQALTGFRVRITADNTDAATAGGVLALAERAVRHAVERHPLTRALMHTSRDLYPGWCLAISNMGEDAEALLTGLQRLETSGARTLLLDVRTGTNGALQRQSRRLQRRG